MKLRAYAKLNLSLRIFEKRPDGFHSLESIMQSVSLHDVITLTPIKSSIEVICSDPTVPQGKDNIAYKAAKLFLRDKKSGVKIHIEKRIPMAAGLAGGSADAAAVLTGLNDEFRMTNDELMKLGANIGSDVPFCLTGGTCLVKGRGEIVIKQEPWPKTYFVLVTPSIHVSTKWAYEEFDRLHLNLPEEIKNDLEPAVVSKHDVITEIKEKLVKLGCSEAQMSGSGPSVFGIVKAKARGEEILRAMKEDHPRAYLVETIDKGVERC